MRKLLKGFLRDRRGSIGLYMAVAILPITLIVGAATDLRRVETMRSVMQDASDAAVLSAARAYMHAGDANPERWTLAHRAAGETLAANLDGRKEQLEAVQWEVVSSPEGTGELVLSTRARAPLAFGGLFGMSDAPIKVSAASVVAVRLEVALVLDTTGSMLENNKLAILKSSTAKLIDQLTAAASHNPRQNPLKLALVPYSNTVRLPTSYAGASWMDGRSSGDGYWKGASGKPAELFNRFERYPGGWGGCVETRPMPHDIDDTPPGSDPDTQFTPYFNSRAGVTDPNQGCGLSEVVKLTTDAAKVKAAALGMQANGYTNIPMGLVWGWHALTPDNGPFGAGNAEPYTLPDMVKAVVLMTDGQNNLGSNPDEYSGVGRMDQNRIGVDETSDTASRQAALDSRLSRLCQNMKDRGIVIYAIRVEVNEGSDAVLRNCATKSDDPSGAPFYHDVKDASQLTNAFDKVGKDLVKLRLSR